jgi:hypothetical protein
MRRRESRRARFCVSATVTTSTRRRRLSRLAALGSVTLVLAGCTRGGPPGPSRTPPSPAATHTASSAASPTASPVPSEPVPSEPVPSEAAEDIIGDGTELDPGVYTWSGFDPHVTFELPDGWEGGHTHDDFFDVWNDAYVAFMRPQTFVTDSGKRIEASELDPAATVAAITGRTGVDASKPFETAVGGAAGFGVDVTAKKDVPMFMLLGEENAVPVATGWHLRYRAVDVDGVTVLVATGLGPGPVDEAGVRRAEDVVHTVEWGSQGRPAPMEGDGVSLEPGSYFHPGYAPGVSFDVGEGWTGGHLHDEFFDVQQEGLLVGFADPAFLVRTDGSSVPAGGLDRTSAVRLLARTLGTDVIGIRPCPYFGELRARCVDAVPEFGVEVLGGPDGRLMLSAGSWNRIAILEFDDHLVLAVVMMQDGLDDELLDHANDVLQTVRWG